MSAKQQVMFWNPAPLVSFVLYILTPRFALERAVEHEKFILTVGSPLPSRVGRKDHPGSRGTARYNTECLIWTARHKGPGKTSDKASATSLAPAVRAKTKGTCLGQRAGRGGRFLGSGAPGGSGQRSRGRLAVAAARHALFRARRGRQRRLCVFQSFRESCLESGFPRIDNSRSMNE